MSDNNSNDKDVFLVEEQKKKQVSSLICLTDSMCAVIVSNP